MKLNRKHILSSINPPLMPLLYFLSYNSAKGKELCLLLITFTCTQEVPNLHMVVIRNAKIMKVLKLE
jgi:hypothetical protein